MGIVEWQHRSSEDLHVRGELCVLYLYSWTSGNARKNLNLLNSLEKCCVHCSFEEYMSKCMRHSDDTVKFKARAICGECLLENFTSQRGNPFSINYNDDQYYKKVG